MNNKRPVNLNLFTIHFPIPAIVSILHRISGVILFLLIPLLLWGFEFSLTDQGFSKWQIWLSYPAFKLFIWLALVPFCFHFVAGVRHLLMDLHMGDQLASGRFSAKLTFIIFIALTILVGIWLW